MGAPGSTFLPAMPFTLVPVAAWQAKFLPILPSILLTAFSIAIVATFDTLLTLRITQKQAGRAIDPVRDLVAAGIGNCVAACTGALATQFRPTSS